MERDPSGLDPHTPGAKLDAGKPRPALVLGAFALALTNATCVWIKGSLPNTDPTVHRKLDDLVSLAARTRAGSGVHDHIHEELADDPVAKLLAVVDVGTYGAAKYSPDGWLGVPDGKRRYAEAAVRHRLKELAGEELDPESGLPHAAHYLWNLLAYQTLYLQETDQ